MSVRSSIYTQISRQIVPTCDQDVSLVNYSCILQYSPCQFLHTWNLTTRGLVNAEANNPSSPTYQFICKPCIHWLLTEVKERARCAILLEYDVSTLIRYRTPLFSTIPIEQLGLLSSYVWHEARLSLLWSEWTLFNHQRKAYFIWNYEIAVVKNEYRNMQIQLSKLHLRLNYSLPVWRYANGAHVDISQANVSLFLLKQHVMKNYEGLKMQLLLLNFRSRGS